MENPILAKMQISESRIRLRFAFLTPPSLSSILNLNTLSEMIWSQHLRMFVLVFALPYQSHSSLDQCSYTHMNIGMGIASGGIGITLTFINCVHRLLSSFDLHTHLWLESCVTWRRSLLLVLLGLLHLRSVESQPPPEAEELDAQQGKYQPHEQHGRGEHWANNSGLLTWKGLLDDKISGGISSRSPTLAHIF